VSQPTHALSIRQPWAYAILHLGKNIENRTWPTRFRGRIRIHAPKQFDQDALIWLQERGYPITQEAWLTGGYIGEVTIADCVAREDLEFPEGHPNPWAFGPWCFTLKHPVAYDRVIPARGRLGFFPMEAVR
jgi:hypothetical protein